MALLSCSAKYCDDHWSWCIGCVDMPSLDSCSRAVNVDYFLNRVIHPSPPKDRDWTLMGLHQNTLLANLKLTMTANWLVTMTIRSLNQSRISPWYWWWSPQRRLLLLHQLCRQLELHLQFRPLSSLFLPGKKEINKHLQGKLQAEGNGVSLETRRIVCLSFSEWKQKGNFIHACIQTTPVNLDLPNIPVRW
jgi:hypothetical protein